MFNNLYYKTLKNSLELKVKDTKIKVEYNKEGNIIDTQKSIGSIIANLTHNVDSAIILSTSIMCLLEKSPCKSVHDCIISTTPELARKYYAAAIYANRHFYLNALVNNVKRLKYYDFITSENQEVKPKYARKATIEKYSAIINET